jgi:hypothetical protein
MGPKKQGISKRAHPLARAPDGFRLLAEGHFCAPEAIAAVAEAFRPVAEARGEDPGAPATGTPTETPRNATEEEPERDESTTSPKGNHLPTRSRTRPRR